MQYNKRQLEKSEFEYLVNVLKQRQTVIKKLGYQSLPNCYDHGDRVGFFYGCGENEFSFGILKESDDRTAFVVADDGKKFEVSPFSLFPVK